MFTKYISEKITEETNFKHEMYNSEKLQAFVHADPTIDDSVYIPKNFPEFTTEQVLTAEWIDGVPLTHKEVLLAKKFDLSEIMRKYIKLFGAQIFKYGFIHSDPHPGNLLVRFDSKGKQQLVLLDHGLYIELNDSFRIEYCNLWRYLFSLDTPGIEEIGKKWGISSLDLFATVVQLRPVLLMPDDNSDSKPDNRNVSDLFRDFIGDKKKFPADLPFLARLDSMS
ncbi:ABC1 family protein lscO [Candida tropicalis]